MNIKPLRDNVLIRIKKADDKSKGGILIPETTREKPYEGEVIAVGVGKLLDNGELHPTVVNVGDQVVFSKYFTIVSVPDCDDLVIMNEENILAIKK